MDERLKHRLIGALVLVVAAVIFVPMLFGPEPASEAGVALRPTDDAAGVRAIPSDTSVDAAAGNLRIPSPASEPPLSDNVAPAEIVSVPASRAREEAPGGAGPTDATKSAADPGYAVQLASFSDARNATALRDRLSAKGYAAFTTGGRDGSRSLTRVYVGPIKDSAEANKMLKALREETELQGLVVRFPGR